MKSIGENIALDMYILALPCQHSWLWSKGIFIDNNTELGTDPAIICERLILHYGNEKDSLK